VYYFCVAFGVHGSGTLFYAIQTGGLCSCEDLIANGNQNAYQNTKVDPNSMD